MKITVRIHANAKNSESFDAVFEGEVVEGLSEMHPKYIAMMFSEKFKDIKDVEIFYEIGKSVKHIQFTGRGMDQFYYSNENHD